MKNFEKPLTWALAIILLGYLFIANCDCGDTCPLETEEVTVEVAIDDEDTTVVIEIAIDSAEVVIDDVEEGSSE